MHEQKNSVDKQCHRQSQWGAKCGSDALGRMDDAALQLMLIHSTCYHSHTPCLKSACDGTLGGPPRFRCRHSVVLGIDQTPG